MIDTKKLFLSINRHSNFFVGVPDSVLKNFLNHLENRKDIKNIIATNEGSAISLGIGYHLSTKKNTLCISSKFRFGKFSKSFSFNCS